MPSMLLPRLPLGVGTQQVLLGDHLEDRADVLRHAAVDEHEAVLQLPARLRRDFRRDRGCGAAGISRPRLMPNSGSPSPAQHAFDQLHSRPNAAGILPAAARSAEPFAEQRARQHEPPLVLLQRPGQRCGLAGGAHAGATSAASRFVETASREPFGMLLTLLTISSPRPGPNNPRQQIGQALCPSLRCPAARCPTR